jgi:PPOX class probable F420-dependent enzyme
MPTIPTSHLDIFETNCMGYVATMRPDGKLSVNPVSVLWDGTALRFSTLKSRRKYRNLQADDRVSVCVQHPANPIRYVEVRGRARFEDDSDRRFIDAIARKYMGVDHYPYDRPGDERVTVRVEIEHVSAPKMPGG